jgi:hypothetical protein
VSKFVKRQKIMTTGMYQVIGGIINAMSDTALRKAAADHFATEFNKRSGSFDPYFWNRLTGGRPAPNSAFPVSKRQ